jgi:hypothetical protein
MGIRVENLVQLFDRLTDDEETITDVLRQIVLENLSAACGEKIAFNVFFTSGKVFALSDQLPHQAGN